MGVNGWMENPAFVSIFPQRCLSRLTSRCPAEAVSCPRTLIHMRVGVWTSASVPPALPLATSLPGEGHPWVLGLPSWTGPLL